MPSDQEMQAEWLARNQPTRLPTVYLMPVVGAAPVKLDRELEFQTFREGVRTSYGQRLNISREAHAKRRVEVIIKRLTERHTIEEMQAICKDEGITMSWLRKMMKANGYQAPGAHEFTGGPKMGRVEFLNLIIAEYTPDQTYANVVRIANKHKRTPDLIRQMLKYAGFDVPKGSRWNG
jgi:MoaA/NifB/PqqE/SkfB family radical SAM enzyme